MKVTDNLTKIQNQIQQACKKVSRDVDQVKIVAVTKYVSTTRAKEAVDAGILHLGENRDEGLLEKWDVLKDKPSWHFIGTLQTRKVKTIIDKVDYIHSLDRLSLAKEIDKRALKPIKCFIQVNLSGEESKHGLDPQDVIAFVKQLEQFKNIHIVGLMTMAPLVEDENLLRECFRGLNHLNEKIKSLNLEYASCSELSMGMSNDFQIAIEEGATFVRIGTALVGE